MKTLVLDSSPTVPIKIPREVNFNVSPAYVGRKLRGQPLLGQGPQVRYSHFVPMGDASPTIKKLLEIPESDNSAKEPIEGRQEILKEEKYINEDKAVTPVKVFDSDFINSAKDYLSTPNEEKKDSYPTTEESTPLMEKNTANLASIVAVARPPPKTMKPRARPSAKSKPKVSKKTGKKKTLMKPKKMTTFKILRKNK